MWYALFKYVLVGPALRVAFRPRVIGRQHLPSRGSVIIVANHCAFVDSLILCLALPRRVTFVAKSDYFECNGLRGRLQRWFFRSVGQVPIDRSGGAASAAALDTAADIVTAGAVWAIYPEGTRTSSGSVHRGHTGAIRVARATETAVLPVGLRGTAGVGVRRPGRRRRTRVEVVIGRPRDPATFTDLDIRAATDSLMREIAILAARPYVDEYATPSGAPRAR